MLDFAKKPPIKMFLELEAPDGSIVYYIDSTCTF